MRYYQIMAEAIQNRPRNLRVYLTNRIRDLDGMLADLQQAKTLIADNTEGESILRSALRYGVDETDEQDVYPATYDLIDVDLDQRYQISNLKRDLEAYLEYGPEFLKYLMNTLGYVRPIHDEIRATIRVLPYAEKGLRMYGFEDNDPDPEYAMAKKLLAGFRILSSVLSRIERLEADVKAKMAAIQHMRSFTLDPHHYRPEHGEVETLYHATAYVKEIVRQGFNVGRPDERKGLGNFGQQSAISFSHDLEICRNIMRSLKEVWMIAHRQLTAPQILGWARAEGIDLQTRWRGQEGRPLPDRSSDPKEVVKLYRLWQWFTKVRVNPVMLNTDELIDVMQTRQLDDIGVIACDVRLGDTSEYRHGESEFRVTADKVVPGTIKQVL